MDGLTVSATTATVNITGGNTGASLINFGDAADGNVGRIYYDHSADFMQFKAADGERLRINSTGIDITGTVTATGGNSTNWNTAYGWGNHASQGYITNSTASLDANKITSGVLNAARIPSPVNGDWWNGGVVKVGTDGVMEVGKYLDFHTADSGGNADYDLRVIASAGALTVDGTISATGGNSTNWNTAYGWGNHASASYATQSYVGTQISNLVDSSPAALNTLNELAAALGDDANFSTTVNANIAAKLPLAGGTMTGNLSAPQLLTTSNGAGTNVKIGDDAWLGDINVANTIRLSGSQNANNGYISFGNSSNTALGRAGTGNLTWGTNSVFHEGYHPNADTLTTARTIAGTSFNGSANIDISYNNLTNKPTIPTNNNQLTNGAGYLTNTSSETISYLNRIHASDGTTPDSFGYDNRYQTFNYGVSSGIVGPLITFGGLGSGYPMQLTGNYSSSGTGIKYRTRNGDTASWNSWYTLWHNGNDGSGSGLDADLLDGQHGSYYSPLVNPVFSNNITVRDNITVGNYSTTDTGSLLLTGSTANKQAVLKCTNGNLHIDAASGNTMYLNFYSGTGFAFGNGATAVAAWMGSDGDLWKGSADNTGSKYWHAGNDGSGSGLDADLLDGYNTSTSATANTVVVREGSGHIYGNYILGSYFNASSGNSENPTIGQIWTQSTGDNYLRKSTPAHFASQMGSQLVRTDGSNAAFVKVPSNYTGNLNSISNAGVYFTEATGSVSNNPFSSSGSFLQLGDAGGTDVRLQFYAKSSLDRIAFRNQWGNGNWGGWHEFWTTANDGSGSGLDADTVDGLQASSFLRSDALTYSSNNIGRANHHLGHLVGGYNNIGGNAANPNPIYSIGTSYLPTATSLSSFYGIGFAHPNLWGSGKTAGWGLYAADAGTVTFTAGYAGAGGIGVWSQGKFVSTPQGTLWGSSNDGSGSGLDADTVDGIQSSQIVSGGSARKSVGVSAFAGVNEVSGFYFGQNITGAPTTDWVNYVHSAGNSWSSSNNYSFQLTHAFHSDNLWVSRTTGGNQSTARKVWDSASDGSGSGLDADLLDGYNAAEGAVNNSIVKRDGDAMITAKKLHLNGGNYEGSIVFGAVDAWHTGIRQHDDGDAEMRIWARNSNGRIHIATGYDGEPASIGRPNDGFVVNANNVGIGDFSGDDPSQKLHVKGNILATGNVTAYSDEKLKDDIQVIENAVEKVKQLRGVTFTRNDLEDQKRHTGVIAQEVEKVLPEVVGYDEDRDTKTVAYGNMVGLLIEAIKEQQELLNKLTSRLDDIEKGE